VREKPLLESGITGQGQYLQANEYDYFVAYYYLLVQKKNGKLFEAVPFFILVLYLD
jgi:hypothetical protein